MIDPIALGLVKEYTLKNDKENPTIWLIGALDSIAAAKIAAGMGHIEIKDGMPVFVSDRPISENNFVIVKYGLKGFKNFKINGVELEFKTTKEKIFNQELDIVSEETLKSIPLFAINELADVIWGSNNVSEALRKN